MVTFTTKEVEEEVGKFAQIYYSTSKKELNKILATINWKIQKYLFKNWISIIDQWAKYFKQGKLVFQKIQPSELKVSSGILKVL